MTTTAVTTTTAQVSGSILSISVANDDDNDDDDDVSESSSDPTRVEIHLVGQSSPCHSPPVSPPLSVGNEMLLDDHDDDNDDDKVSSTLRASSPSDSPPPLLEHGNQNVVLVDKTSLASSSSRSSCSSASMDVFNKDPKLVDRYDRSPPPPPVLVSDWASPSSREDDEQDCVEVATPGGDGVLSGTTTSIITTTSSIEDRADYILSQARSFASLSAANTTTTAIDSPAGDAARRAEILEQARSQAGYKQFLQSPGKIRTTEEVLLLAGQVLSPNRTKPTSSESNSNNRVIHIESIFKDSFDLFAKPSESSSITTTDHQDHYDMKPEKEMKVNLHAPLETVISEVVSEDSMLSDLRHVEEETIHTSNNNPKERRPFSLLSFLRCEQTAGATLSTPQSPAERKRPPPVQKRRLNGFNPLTCSSRARQSVFSTDEDDLNQRDSLLLSPTNSLLKQVQPFSKSSHAEAIRANEVDPRMPIWMAEHGEGECDLSRPLPDENFYSLGHSRAIVVHEIARGDWTWCTAWSPDGGRLALATENHHLAVVETTASAVWRVKHDERITRPGKDGTTHSIRSIAWGQNFIAIGGTGNAVSILAPIEPYPILHTIPDTGFVGSLSWRKDTTVLAIGSREDKCIVVNISAADGDGGVAPGRHIRSTILHEISREDWVNAVSFSPGGTALAIGDRKGKVSIHRYNQMKPTSPSVIAPPEISPIGEVTLADSVLDIEWSADGKWLYAGGEDFCVTVINTADWTPVHKVERKKWVQFISSSNRGSHVAVGGVASEVSILDVKEQWKSAMKIELKGLVPLSAKWHPKDQYLALTGQDQSVVVVETTNARHVHGHCLHSISPVLEVEFSPDGQMVVIGNEAGVVTFFALEDSVFVTRYEMVLTSGEQQSIRWSRNGQYVVIGCSDQVIVVSKISPKKMEKMPQNAAGFAVRKVIRGLGKVRSVSINATCQYVAVGGTTTQILDAADQFSCVREWKKRIVQCNAFSPDGAWLASIGRNENLTIYNTNNTRVDNWRVVFTLRAERAGLALAWGPAAVNGLQYLAYGGGNNTITVIEIRTNEETWETVLEVPRAGVIHDLDWNEVGMLAAAIGDGTVTIIDLEYLQSGWAMNEMDYTWQRQGVTCFTEVRRNKGKNSMRTVRWIPSSIDRSLLAIGGTDGDLEIVDLTQRNRCRGFLKDCSEKSIKDTTAK